MQALIGWVNSLRPQQRKQIAMGIVAAALLFGFWLSNQQSPASSVETVPTEVFVPSKIRVHVVGEVMAPGLYELGVGSIANDAIELAGGLTSEAAAESVNLARVLVDGEQIIVLNSADLIAGVPGGKTSINRASVSELDALPGIGPAIAGRIVEHRNKVGSFKSIEELTSVSGIGSKLFEQIRDQLTL